MVQLSIFAVYPPDQLHLAQVKKTSFWFPVVGQEVLDVVDGSGGEFTRYHLELYNLKEDIGKKMIWEKRILKTQRNFCTY